MSTLSDYYAILDAMKGKSQGNGTGSKNVVLTPAIRAEIFRISTFLSVDSIATRLHISERSVQKVLDAAKNVQK